MPVLLLLVARILACESQRFICRRLGENQGADGSSPSPKDV